MKQNEYIERHIATHTTRSAEDRSAVAFLESALNPGGRICTTFSSDDKWPNHDGFFEYVSNPDISKSPKQNFIVQIKGNHTYDEKDGVVSYCLKSLSFPAFIAKEVTADPGILFVVLDPDVRNGQRIFWKVMSKAFLSDIDFAKDSKTIKFFPEDEIKNTDESIELFCERLNGIIDTHLFLNKLNSNDLEQEEALSIFEYQCNEISQFIEIVYDNPQCREEVSRRIVRDRQRENERFIKDCRINFDDVNKQIALKYLFVNSNVMLIYGAAGTGKTTLIKYISNMYENVRKLYLTKTHTALQNVKRYINNMSDNCDFEIIDSITRSNSVVSHDIVFVDECSTIDNRTMELLLGKISNDTLLVLSGDIYQIESIDFGNWFFYAKDVIKAKGASIELCHTWRTDKESLKSLWSAVREKSAIVTEKLSMDGPFSENLGENIFHLDDDEVVLCLNYDGKFGLNNMNQYFQNANTNSEAFSWEEWTYKIGDRIIFTNTKRSTLLYNNLKGTITNITYGEKKIIFEIEVKTFFIESQCEEETFNYIETTQNGTIIEIDVISWDDELPEEEKVKTVIPFQLAYAVSIHKAQGLEYKSVKVVIPSSNAEKITHSIFYTAITRAKEKLKIFWSAETMKNIIESFSSDDTEQRTLPIIKRELCQ